jgi:3'-phosphoadenosine 5'-phosphosulfate (PAPS) 3'-phosphatase
VGLTPRDQGSKRGIVENVWMLEPICDVLTKAVLAGAREVIGHRQRGAVSARYKTAVELVTEADEASDAAMRAVLERGLAAIDPSISLRLEESGSSGPQARRHVGADPLDGTSHFAAGGSMYSVQAHYVEDGAPLVGIVFQPEVFLPLSETERCLGRLVYAVRGHGAFVQRSEFGGGDFQLSSPRRVDRRAPTGRPTFVAAVPITTKMSPAERASAQRVYDSGVLAASMGTGNAGGNAMMVVFGGLDVYANLGAGDELDLAPPQVIAEEVGLTVWGPDRRPPVWHVRKMPVIFAPDDATAERFLTAAGL